MPVATNPNYHRPATLLPTPTQRPLDPRQQRSLPQGISGNPLGYTRQVQGDELSQNQLTGMLDEGGRYITSARGRGQRLAASRGMLNSSAAAAASEASAIDAAAPFALQDAQTYAQAAGQNLDSLGRQRISQEGNETSILSASIGANASMYNTDIGADLTREGRDFEREMTQGERDWRTGERIGDQDWRSGESELDRQFGRDQGNQSFRMTLGGGILASLINDPDYFRDPQGAIGAFETWYDEVRRIIGDLDLGG